MPYSNNKGADQPAHPRSLISAFVVRCLDSIISLLAIAEISRPELVSSTEQAGLSLTWSYIPKTGFIVTWFKYLLSNIDPRIPSDTAMKITLNNRNSHENFCNRNYRSCDIYPHHSSQSLSFIARYHHCGSQ